MYVDKLNTFRAEVIMGGDFNINLLDILKRNIVSDYFNAVSTHSCHPHIILPLGYRDVVLHLSIIS